MRRDKAYEGLIMDLGVSEGNDTAYYLAKGFQVIAVEADPDMCAKLRVRFALEIASGALVVLNFAVAEHFGESLEIFAHKVHQGVSGIRKRGDVTDADYTGHAVMTIDWTTLVAQAGLPRYVKIDVEGSEEPFLRSMLGERDFPEFISAECYAFRPIEMFHQMGYRRFKLVDQNPPGGFQLPARQMEGMPVRLVNTFHTSGPFGLDVFGDGEWLSFAQVKPAWEAASQMFHRTWFDCHAWMPG